MSKRKLSQEEREQRNLRIEQRAAERRMKYGNGREGDADLLTMTLPTPEWENQRKKNPEEFQRLWRMVKTPMKGPRSASSGDMRELALDFWGAAYVCVGDRRQQESI